jgi:hypothetical protein
MNDEFRDTLAAVLGKKRKRSGLYRSVKDGDLTTPIQLDEFLEGVGGVLRLPPKEPVKPAAAPARAPFTISLPRYWRLVPVPLLGLALATWFLSRPSADQGTAVLPAPLVGTWITSDPRYKDRNFQISEGFVVFKNGERADDQTAHPIQRVVTEERADTTVATISYLEGNAPYELGLKYIPRPKPTIILSNQPEMTWRREAAPNPSR